MVQRRLIEAKPERTVQIIRKGPFLVECAVVVDGEAVAVFGAGPAWLQARCSSHGRCLQAGGGSSPANAAVWAPVIVIREEPRQHVEPLAVGVVRS